MVILTLLVLGVVGLFLLMLAVGSVNIPLSQVIAALFGASDANPSAVATIIWQFRMPRALTAALAGAALAVGGLQMQTLFRNPLTDPFVLGISSGASLGVALVVLTAGTTGMTLLAGLAGLGDYGIVIAASLGAGLTLALVLMFAGRLRQSMALLIFGLMFGYAVSALVSLVLYFSIAERIQAYVNWTFGSFGGITWRQMPIFAVVVIVGLGLAYLLVKPLNALLLGETYAQSMGINLRMARAGIILSTALLAGGVTAFCGPIGFLGIAVPHLARMLSRSADHRLLLPMVTLLGAIVAMGADLAAQLPGNQVILPLNAVLALLGAPVVIAIILRQQNLRASFAG